MCCEPQLSGALHLLPSTGHILFVVCAILSLMANPRGSGFLKGGGQRHFWIKRRKWPLERFPDVNLSDKVCLLETVPDFDPSYEFDYSPRELQLITEKILLQDPKPPRQDPMWLNAGMYRRRAKREIFVSSGTPDPSYVSGLYWRSHPDGRRPRTVAERRKSGASYYV